MGFHPPNGLFTGNSIKIDDLGLPYFRKPHTLQDRRIFFWQSSFLTSSHLILSGQICFVSPQSVSSDTSAHIISCHLLPRLLMSASSDLILKESPYPRPLFLISSSFLGSSHSISPCLLFLCPDLIFSHLFFCNVGFQYDLQRNFAKQRSSLQEKDRQKRKRKTNAHHCNLCAATQLRFSEKGCKTPGNYSVDGSILQWPWHSGSTAPTLTTAASSSIHPAVQSDLQCACKTAWGR